MPVDRVFDSVERGVPPGPVGRRITPTTEGAAMTGPTGTDNAAADPDAAEEYADEVGVDPTQDEIDTYRRLEGEDSDEPPAAVDEPSAG
jgi:hypothetical protein